MIRQWIENAFNCVKNDKILVICGGQGSGKTVALNAIEKFGSVPVAYYTNNMFNSFRTSCLVVCQEIVTPLPELKEMFQEKVVTIHRKAKEPIEVENTSNWAILTNDPECFKNDEMFLIVRPLDVIVVVYELTDLTW